MTSVLRTFLGVLGLILVTVFYQNCSDVGFSGIESVALGSIEPIDNVCVESMTEDTPDVFLPYTPIPTVDLPDSCFNGLELNNTIANRISFLSFQEATPQVRKVRIEFATYTKSDSIAIIAEDSGGEKTYLFAQCRVRTWDFRDPTDGHSRPPEDTIRFSEFVIPVGTRKLVLDMEGANSPFYIRLQGLCDFDLANGEFLLPINDGRQSIRLYPKNSSGSK